MDDRIKNKAKISPKSLLYFITYQTLCCACLYLWALSPIVDKVRMSTWLPMDAQLLDIDLEVYQDGHSTYRQVVASYEYYINGKTYWGNRVDIHSESDDSAGGYYHEIMYDTLQKYKRQKGTFSGWYNPNDPYDSVLDRGLRWSEIIVPGSVCFVFILIGVVVLRIDTLQEQRQSPKLIERKPWLAKNKWSSEGILSETRVILKKQLWGGVLVFLLGLIFIFIGLTFLSNWNSDGLIALILGVVSCLFIIVPIINWSRYKAIGRVPIVMRPFPGRIGGKVSGYIQFPPLLALTDKSIRVKLKQFACVTEGRGKDARKREYVNWEKMIQGNLKATAVGNRVYFSFDIPEGLPESSTSVYCGDREYWYLNVSGEIRGDYFEREYELPVFKLASSEHGATN
ncbi:DUF3592 domain-containing protein [Microbulbifer sp. ZKSA002]|uniref:DUF3592 domain-containing protein n=1 Tax=Microbulbifer sp. ZKSA002 TaxID=3243388 RepID=UPI00403A1F28